MSSLRLRLCVGVIVTRLLLANPAAAVEVCTPGFSSASALEAEEMRINGEQHLTTARTLPVADKRRSVELAQAESLFRGATSAVACIVPLHWVRLAETLALEQRYLQARVVFQQLLEHQSELIKRRIYDEPLRAAIAGDAALAGKLVHLELIVHAEHCGTPLVYVDGTPTEPGSMQRDPGLVRIRASADGCEPQSTEYVLAEGTTRSIVIRLSPPRPRDPSSSSSSTRSTWFSASTLGVPRWIWVTAGGTLVLAGGGYATYRLLSPTSSSGEPLPTGTWGQAFVR